MTLMYMLNVQGRRTAQSALFSLTAFAHVTCRLMTPMPAEERIRSRCACTIVHRLLPNTHPGVHQRRGVGGRERHPVARGPVLRLGLALLGLHYPLPGRQPLVGELATSVLQTVLIHVVCMPEVSAAGQIRIACWACINSASHFEAGC